MSARVLGGIEAGGTKFVCAVGLEPGEIAREERFPTTTPEETLNRARGFFRQCEADFGRLSALGIASFGPINCRADSPGYGFITTTPKPGWGQCDLLGAMRREFPVPCGFDTDVNGAALAEWKWGAGRGRSTCLYVTVGTGIGGGFVIDGQSIKGLLHPEMGHVRPRRHPDDDFPGCCPYHGDCLEGMASGFAMEKRWGKSARDLPADHRAWVFEADYLAQAVAGWILVLSPETVVLGGGIMEQAHLFPRIRERVRELLNGYIQAPAVLDMDPGYITPPGLGSRSGILGALALAEAASAQRQRT